MAVEGKVVVMAAGVTAAAGRESTAAAEETEPHLQAMETARAKAPSRVKAMAV